MGEGRPVLPVVALDRVLSRHVELPDLVPVRVPTREAGPPLDLPRAVAEQLAPALEALRPGDRVAVGVGSRGIARIAQVVAAVVREVRDRGGVPFLVPAMGSHGGASAEGQTAVLADLGITADLAPIRAQMETVLLGRAADVDVHVGAAALDAHHVLLVNRIKSHTSFTGRIESGLAKMAAIGLGKQRGAEELHRLGPLQLERRILAAVGLLRSRVPLLGGLALVEGHDKDLREIAFVPAAEIGGPTEAALLERARREEPRLPFADLDVLVVDLMGKEISGTGMDTNVLGRRMVRGSPEPSGPDITNVVVLAISPGSEGNAVGLGLADFAPVSLLDGVDLATTYANALTAGIQGVQRAQIPIVLATDRDAVAAGIMTANVPDPAQARVARIRHTLALDRLLVSPALLAEHQELVRTGPPVPLADRDGRIHPWPEERNEP